MDVDIRIPIGLLFAILGLILVLFGLYSMNDTDLYARSLGRNINLWTGLVMLLFGGLMLFFTLRKKKSS
jgi:ABC-type Fe3+-siderophore transport system permease subunit